METIDVTMTIKELVEEIHWLEYQINSYEVTKSTKKELTECQRLIGQRRQLKEVLGGIIALQLKDIPWK